MHLEMPLMVGRLGQHLRRCAAVSEGCEGEEEAEEERGEATAGGGAPEGPSNTLPRASMGNYLALLGDIFDGAKVRSGAYRDFLLRQAPGFRAVFVLAGNHEFYRAEYGQGRASLAALCEEVSRELQGQPTVHFLDCGRVDLPGSSVRVLGCTLWSHVDEAHAKAAAGSMTDYVAISVRADEAPEGGAPARPPRRKATVEDTNAWHARELAWLEGELSRAEADGRRCVVLTHHAPTFHEACPPKHRTSALNCAFCSDLERLLRPPVAAWLYGHTHWSTWQRFRRPPGGTPGVPGCWSSLEAELDALGEAACAAEAGEILVASNQLGYGTAEHLCARCRPALLLELPPDGVRATLRCPRRLAAPVPPVAG